MHSLTQLCILAVSGSLFTGLGDVRAAGAVRMMNERAADGEQARGEQGAGGSRRDGGVIVPEMEINLVCGTEDVNLELQRPDSLTVYYRVKSASRGLFTFSAND